MVVGCAEVKYNLETLQRNALVYTIVGKLENVLQPGMNYTRSARMQFSRYSFLNFKWRAGA